MQLKWFRRYGQISAPKNAKIVPKISFLFFQNRKIILGDSCSRHFLKGPLKSISCKNFRYVAQTVQKIQPKRCSKKSENCLKISFLFFLNRKIILRDSCSRHFLKGPLKSISCKNFRYVAQTVQKIWLKWGSKNMKIIQKYF